MRIETLDTSAVIVTRDVHLGGGLPGLEELAEDMTRRGFDPARYPPEIQAGLREARTRGACRNVRETALFALAFAEADRSATQGRAPPPDAGAAGSRQAAAERRAAAARKAAQAAAEDRARANRAALAEACGARYVPEEGRDDVARIMVERGLAVDEAYEAWIAEDEPTVGFGGRSGLTGICR